MSRSLVTSTPRVRHKTDNSSYLLAIPICSTITGVPEGILFTLRNECNDESVAIDDPYASA